MASKVGQRSASIALAAVLWALPALCGQTAAFGQSRWVQIDYADRTITYDLTTVQLLDPGRFTILSNALDHPDVMRFRLAALDTMKSFCGHPDGEYAAPAALFTLGSPDMPVEKIVVKTQPTGGVPFKDVTWGFPYRRLAINYATGLKEHVGFFDCQGPAVSSTDKEYSELRSMIMNGTSIKELYDCRHGVMGLFANTDDPPARAVTSTNITGGYLDAYVRLCPIIVGGQPYMPNKAPSQ